jgi:hypothetical protein
MLFHPKNDDWLGRLQEQLRHAQAITPELVSDIAAGCPRIAVLVGIQARPRIERLVASEAWIEVALALVELELPRWKLRRLLYEDGEWHCCLSRQPELPAWLDETVETRHQDLPLAILTAFVEARSAATAARDVDDIVPCVSPEQCQAISCDNFA